MHLGICEGPVDALLQLRSEDKAAWSGNVTASGQITVDATQIFGGDEREGGLQGTVDVMMGDAAQSANAYLTAQQGTPQPAYRGILGLVFRAFYWGNSPYLKPLASLVRRIKAAWSTGSAWYPEKAEIAFGTIVNAAAFREDFQSWPQIYAVDGLAAFDPGASEHGAAIAISGISGVSASASRAIPSQQYTAAQFYAKLDYNAEGSGDADVISARLYQGATAALTIDVMGDAVGMALNRPPAINGVDIGANALEAGEWYRFDLAIDWEAGTAAYTVTVVASGAVLGSGSTSIGGVTAIDRVEFFVDQLDEGDEDVVATVADLTLSSAAPVVGMNPAHILYQCLTDTSFGMGYSPATINEASFEAAADQFHSEGLGLCMHWTQQEPIDAFMQRVIDHAGAALVQHPATGLFELVPLRGDYDVGSLPVFDASNIDSVLSYQKPSPAEATNEVTVRFGDVAAGPGKVGSVRVQNVANITSQGGVVSKTVQYPGAFYAALALRLAMRDLKAVSSPQAKVRLRVQRKAWSLTRGAVFVFTWPKLSISGMVLRVLSINYGSLTDAMIEIDAAEDVYSMPATTYGAEQPSGWVPPVTTPQVAAQRLVREAGYYEAQLLLGAAEAQALAETAGFVIAAAARPSGAALDFGMRTRVGSEAYAERDRSAFAPSGTLDAAIAHADTEATIADLLDGGLVQVGSYAQIDNEIVRVDAWDAETGEIELGRGVMGTVAAVHAEGARIFFLDQFFAADTTERLDSEDVDVKVLPRTSQGELAENLAPTDTVTIEGLIARPYPPGQLRINALAYPSTVDIADFTISWAHRHRLQQNLEGDESGNIGPEDGTTYTVELSDADTEEALHTETGITGTSYEVDDADIVVDRNVRVRLWAVRDGLASAQRHDFVVAVTGSAPSARLVAQRARVAVTPPGNARTYNAWPVSCRLGNGDILVGYTSTEDHHVSLNAAAVLKRSTDNGETWGSEVVIFDHATKFTTVYGLGQSASGRVFATLWTDSGSGSSDGEALIAYSDDNGATWSTPTSLASAAGLTGRSYGSGRVVVAANGDLLMTVEGTSSGGSWPADSRAVLLRSTNNGSSWGSPVTIASAALYPGITGVFWAEPKLLVLPSGRVLCFHRCYETSGDTYLSHSDDHGATWSTPAPAFALVGAPEACVMEDGTIVVPGRLNSATGRCVAYSSQDGGATWYLAHLDDPGFDTVYATPVDLLDGRVLVVYGSEVSSGSTSAIRSAVCALVAAAHAPWGAFGTNVSTLDPLVAVCTGGGGMARGATGVSSGRYYFEAVPIEGDNIQMFGMANSSADTSTYPGDSSGSVGVYFGTGNRYQDGSNLGALWGAQQVGQPVGIEYDNGTIKAWNPLTATLIGTIGTVSGTAYAAWGPGTFGAGVRAAAINTTGPFINLPTGCAALG